MVHLVYVPEGVPVCVSVLFVLTASKYSNHHGKNVSPSLLLVTMLKLAVTDAGVWNII